MGLFDELVDEGGDPAFLYLLHVLLELQKLGGLFLGELVLGFFLLAAISFERVPPAIELRVVQVVIQKVLIN